MRCKEFNNFPRERERLYEKRPIGRSVVVSHTIIYTELWPLQMIHFQSREMPEKPWSPL